LVDASVLVEWRAGKQSALAADLDSPVLPLEDADALACEGQSLRTGLDEVAHSFEVNDQVAGHRRLRDAKAGRPSPRGFPMQEKTPDGQDDVPELQQSLR
jgi:hypothetical protein